MSFVHFRTLVTYIGRPNGGKGIDLFCFESIPSVNNFFGDGRIKDIAMYMWSNLN